MVNIDGRHRLAVVVCGMLLGACSSVAAQTPSLPAPSASPPAVQDPLERETPFGTITGFSSAVHRGDLAVAVRYLQAGRRSSRQLETLATDLCDVLDRYFTKSLTSISMQSAGDIADGLEPNRERIPLTIGNKPVDLFMTRVTDPGAGSIWLFSSESLGNVRGLQRSDTDTLVERVMPDTLSARSYFGISLAQWIVWAGSILLPMLLFWALAHLVPWTVRRRTADVTRRAAFLQWWGGVRWLLIIALTLVFHLETMPLLGLSLTLRYAYSRFGLTLTVIVSTLLVWRLVAVTCHQAALAAMRHGRSDRRSLIQLGERVLKVLVVLTATLALCALGGLDLTTALAGAGIVGVAVALGAQKSVENLLGGISLLTDRALAVGDYCRLSDREGWVEDITLRSVRLRTVEQTLLSVPAGQLAQGSIENFATRGKVLVKSILRLRYGTTGDQVRAILEGARQLLSEHPTVDRESARVRLIAFGAQAIELELFAYITTSDYAKFLEVRESLLLQLAHVVESSGSGFAVPTEFIYMRGDAEHNQLPAPVQAAEARVQPS